jgi:mono/diheme cytochrome c family protein
MTNRKLAALWLLAMALLLWAAPSGWGQDDGAALYKANCAVCHKADASGNPAMKSPALQGKTFAAVKKAIDTSPKHAIVKKKLNEDQLKAIAEYLGKLK